VHEREARNPDPWDGEEPEAPAAAEEVELDNGNSPDDALGLYLRQMGAIPLLNRDQELTLARRLERLRGRFRRAALSNWDTLARVLDLFSRVQAGTVAIDPVIDVIASLGLRREQSLKRLPYNLRTLRHLLKKAVADFGVLQRTGS